MSYALLPGTDLESVPGPAVLSCTLTKYLSFFCTVHSSCSSTRCSNLYLCHRFCLYLDQPCQLCLLSDALAVPRWWLKLYTCAWSSEAATGPGWEGPPNCPTCWPGCLTSQPWSAYIRPLPQLYSWPPPSPPPRLTYRANMDIWDLFTGGGEGYPPIKELYSLPQRVLNDL